MQPTEPPTRPVPRSAADRLLAWIRWFGPFRVASGALGLLALVAVGLWAVRAPAPAATDPGARAPVPTASDEIPVVTLVGRAPQAAPTTILVHVAGAVAAPGVHELTSGSRVVDAVSAAGGPLDLAELDALNLAAQVSDGQRIHVPRLGEVVVGAEPLGGDGQPPIIDLNRAGATELEDLPGVGPAIAAEILADRERNGPFGSVDELLRVSGIGPAKLTALRDRATAS